MWEVFCRSGRIEDYLKYKALEEENSDDNDKGSDNS